MYIYVKEKHSLRLQTRLVSLSTSQETIYSVVALRPAQCLGPYIVANDESERAIMLS